VLRIFVTGGAPVRGGGGMPQRISTISLPTSVFRMTGAGSSGRLGVVQSSRSDHFSSAKNRQVPRASARRQRVAILERDGAKVRQLGAEQSKINTAFASDKRADLRRLNHAGTASSHEDSR
jgi:hypothetical protein